MIGRVRNRKELGGNEEGEIAEKRKPDDWKKKKGTAK